MRVKTTLLCSLVATVGLVNICVAAEGASAVPAVAPVKAMTGQEIAFDKNKGNCLSCHVIHDPKATAPGNLGPELVGLKDRYTRETLRAQIWDATKANPNTAMPPMGRNKILTEEEIDKVVDYLLSL
ncbi:MAG TPA: sulfur oxidation c-type cytochrome SoxX [Candidatus Paceibacterota bacterium]